MVTYLNSIGVGSNGVITEADAAAATIVANSANTTVTKFNELKYFTQITQSRGGLNGNNSGWVRFKDWTSLEETDISNFTSIGHFSQYGYEDTFSGCTSLKKVTASDKLTAIGHAVFNGDSQLEDILNLDGTITVYGYAFNNCTKLKEECFNNVEILFPVQGFNVSTNSQFCQTKAITRLTLSSANTYIPSNCFQNSNIKTINIPSGITIFYNNCFKDSKLEIDASYVSHAKEYYDSCFVRCDITGTFAPDNNPTLLDKYSFLGTKISSVDLSSTSLTTIYQGAFADCKNLTSVTLPQSLTTINNSVFSGCTSLTSINLDSCTSLGDSAFRGAGLTSVDLSNSAITSLPDNCFRDCNNLGLVKLPTSCTELGNAAFNACSNLQISASDLTRLTYFGDSCFAYSGLTGELTFPNITRLKANAFDRTTVTKLDFTGSPFTSVGTYFGNGLQSLAKVILPDTVQEITGVILAGCTGLQYIKCLATTPPTAAGTIGQGIQNPTFKIYVPDASVNAYKAATYWSDHSARIFGLSQFATDFPNG